MHNAVGCAGTLAAGVSTGTGLPAVEAQHITLELAGGLLLADNDDNSTSNSRLALPRRTVAPACRAFEGGDYKHGGHA